MLSPLDFGENAHLQDGDFVQLLQTLRLGSTIVDHDGIDVLHVGDADELVDGGVVALVAFERRIGGLPFSKPLESERFRIGPVKPTEFDRFGIQIAQGHPLHYHSPFLSFTQT